MPLLCDNNDYKYIALKPLDALPGSIHPKNILKDYIKKLHHSALDLCCLSYTIFRLRVKTTTTTTASHNLQLDKKEVSYNK